MTQLVNSYKQKYQPTKKIYLYFKQTNPDENSIQIALYISLQLMFTFYIHNNISFMKYEYSMKYTQTDRHKHLSRYNTSYTHTHFILCHNGKQTATRVHCMVCYNGSETRRIDREVNRQQMKDRRTSVPCLVCSTGMV